MLTWLKRILSILLAAWLLAACTTTPKVFENRNERESRLSGTIVLWQSFPESDYKESLIALYKEIFDDYIRKFTKLYPQVKILTNFIAAEELVEKLEGEVEKGLGPDLIFTQHFHIFPLIKAKVLVPVDKDSIEISQFRSEALDQVLYQGKMYGVPLDLITQVLCFNKKKVKELPETLSELMTQARAGNTVGILSRFDDTLWGTRIFGGQVLDTQGRMILDQGGGWVRWMEWLINAKNEPKLILNEDPLILQNAFIEEQLAYNVCWSSQIPLLRESLGSDKLGVTLLPGEENQQAAPPLLVEALLFSSASSTTQNQIALKFAQFLANNQQQIDVATRLSSVIPANKNAIIDHRLFPLQGILQKQSQKVVVYSLDQTKKINAIINYGRDFYTRVMEGEISPEQAASQLTQTINSQFE